MTLLVKGRSATVRYKDPAFEQALQGLRRGSFITESTLLSFSGMPKAHLEGAAREVAQQLGRPLVRLDLTRLVSKYIGETEKNLDGLLREAEVSGAILLFDEADALFGRRTEVKDAHDRYANIDTNYLLARLEQHRGLIIANFNSMVEAEKPRSRMRQLAVRFPPH
jgi:SpoVK/Ycf46/Vps4 family AAA+-type ATPase